MYRLNKFRRGNQIFFHRYMPHNLWKCRTSNRHLSLHLQKNDVSRALASVGNEIHGFRVSDVVDVRDFSCKLIRLKHINTGAQYTHVERNDLNNVFAVAFRTTPFDSTGLPHILEHITLMGSKKYPCRDPFFKMLNRSLATYLNACTAADFTVYPFATQNQVDYYNLMSVYLDAVFQPKLRENDFRMEGWRLEHEDVTDPQSPIVLKGVVFNEMKGVFSENQNLFTEKLLNNLLPSHTYGVCSGGDPMVIPSLTYENLINFQRKHYHPSNCRIYSYGNFNFVDHLKFIHENYLKFCDFCESYYENTKVPPEIRWLQPKRKHIHCKYDPLTADSLKQSSIAISYLCADVKNVYEIFELKILSQLLTDGPNASFYKSLIEPNIGSGYVPATGFDSQTRDTSFTIGLQGVNSDNFEQIENAVYRTFNDCIAHNFDMANVESILHGIELNLKHQGSDFGLQLLFGISALWNHDGDIVDSLRITDHIARFRANISNDPLYLQKLVEKYFESNPHRLILTMTPDKDFEIRLKDEENKLLCQKLTTLGVEKVKEIYEIGLQLRREQEKDEDISCLPTLTINDINKQCEFPPITYATNTTNIPIQVCVVPTNNITYFRSLLDISALTDNQKQYLPLFVQIVSQMGTNSCDYRTFDKMVYAKTLGLNVGVHIADNVADANAFEESISLGSLCLDQNVNDMFDLWSMFFNEVCLADVDRFTTLVRTIAGNLTNGVADSGHRYAMLYASSLLSPASYHRERYGGLTYIQQMKSIAAQDNLNSLLGEMRTIAQMLLNRKRMRSALNVCTSQTDAAVDSVKNFIERLSGDYEGIIRCNSSSVDVAYSSKSLHFVLPFAVNHTSKAMLCVPYAHPDFAALRVLSKLVTAKYLLPLIRERFGAYGAGAVISTNGIFQFYSYRDPNSTSTINIFDDVGNWLQKNKFSDLDVVEAKLGVFRDIDAPISPGEHGMRTFLYGIDDELFTEHRLRVLNVKREELIEVGVKYFNDAGISTNVIIGSENQTVDGWEKIFSE